MFRIQWNSKRLAAFLLSVCMAGACVPASPAAAEDDALALRIARVEVDKKTLGDDRQVSVEVRLQGNENGFIASEFGIAFDERLTLTDVRSDSEAGRCFSYSSTPENHMIWLSGASASPEATATVGRNRLLTLDFTLPESYSSGDVYYIGYEWNSVDGESAFWYTAPGTDQLTSLMSYSVAGSITIPDPDAPHLSRSDLTMNPGATYELTAQNIDEEGVWFSDDESVATVKDGVITAVAPGTCMISVFYTAAGALLSCEVTVSRDFHYSMSDQTPITITSMDQETWLVYPGAVGSIQWLSTNPSVVSVDDGRLKPISSGTAQIIASNNGVSLMRTVIVAPGSTAPSETKPLSEETSPTSSALQTPSMPSSDSPAPSVSGDLNGDKIVDIIDVIGISKFLLGSSTLDDAQRKTADVFHDGSLDSTDSLTLLKYVVELVPELPVEP